VHFSLVFEEGDMAEINPIARGLESFAAKPATALPRLLVRLGCILFGHSVDNSRFGCDARGSSRVCLCGSAYLQNGGEETRIRHTVSCFTNLFGHRVHAVTERAGFSEYACECGHNFLKRAQRLKRVTHPLICPLVGHFVSHVEQRGSYGEYVCRNCGHTFLFAGCPTGATPPRVGR
jgi:predicted RNA-binding Zn-ribbon protein involved in translation (DUF1610 family)